MKKEPKIEWRMVDNFLHAGCEEIDIAACLGVSDEHLYEECLKDNMITFDLYSKQHRIKGKAILRLKQYKKAIEGHPTMLIWLGKQMLGQKEAPSEALEFDGNLLYLIDKLKENDQMLVNHPHLEIEEDNANKGV